MRQRNSKRKGKREVKDGENENEEKRETEKDYKHNQPLQYSTMAEEIGEEGFLFLWFSILFGHLEVLPPFVVEFGPLLFGKVRSMPQGLHHVVNADQQLTYIYHRSYKGQTEVKQGSNTVWATGIGSKEYVNIPLLHFI